MNIRLTLVLIGLALQGCATMSSDECASADWRAYGYQDGASGETPAKAEKRAKACDKHGYAMDRGLYDSGRHEGLKTYCTPDTGYRIGEKGDTYNGVCVNHGEDQFLAAYDRGYELYGFTSAVVYAGVKLRDAESKHSRLNAELEDYSDGHRDEGVSMEDHNKRMLDLWSERKWLAQEAIPYWRIEERNAERELQSYRAKVAANDPGLGNLKPGAFIGPQPYNGPTKTDAAEMLAEVFGQLNSR